MTEGPAPPPHWEADVVAADGGTVHLRPIRPTDAEALVAFHAGLSQRTRYLRYFSAYPRIPERDLVRFTNVDHHDRVAFVAELAGEIIAVGRYERHAGTDDAEVAFVVADAHQGRGIGSVLLEHLAAAAREIGVHRFVAVVLAENSSMIRVFRDAGFETTRHVEHGEVTLEFDVAETATTAAVMREREQRAEARSIGRLLRPGSVAVVGASNDEGKVGHARVRQPAAHRLRGPAVPDEPRRPARRRRAARTRPCSTSPTTSSTWSSSPCRPPRCPGWSSSARGAACAASSSSPAASASGAPPSSAQPDATRSATSSPRRGRTACASSGRTASASSTPIRRYG